MTPSDRHTRREERTKEMTGNLNFEFDQRNLPDNLKGDDPQAAFVDAVFNKMQGSSAGVQRTDPLFAAVVGMLILDGYTDPSSGSFEGGFWAVRGETAKSAKGTDSKGQTTDVMNSSVYAEVASKIKDYPGHGGVVFYQELAAVSRMLLANSDAVAINSPGFLSQIRVADDDYMTNGPQGADSFDLPALTGDGAASPDDIRQDNIRAVGVIFAGYQLEQLRLFEVVDRIAETWWNGQLPVGTDAGTKALDSYYWSSEFRLSDAARHMQYSRVLGTPGGEVSTEVQPNTQLNDLWMRFIASLAEYDRQQRVSDIVSGQRTSALSLTAEAVRQSGRNLAANASLYGWGGTQFAARRLAKQVATSFDILNNKDIQSAYGVDGPYKVIERVATEQWGASPNIVKYRALAEAGRNILNLIAKYSTIWSGSNKPLFDDPSTTAQTLADGFQAIVAALTAAQTGGAPVSSSHAPATADGGSSNSGNPAATSSDISDEDRDTFLREAGSVIAVQGIKDDTVSQLSEPSETQYAPSIPTVTSGGGGGNGTAGLDQLKQMVSQGQVPDINTLKNLVMGSH
jgi:hypothetical protein